MNAIFVTTEGMLISMAFFSSIPHMANISRLIDSFEKIVENRKFDALLDIKKNQFNTFQDRYTQHRRLCSKKAIDSWKD